MKEFQCRKQKSRLHVGVLASGVWAVRKRKRPLYYAFASPSVLDGQVLGQSRSLPPRPQPFPRFTCLLLKVGQIRSGTSRRDAEDRKPIFTSPFPPIRYFESLMLRCFNLAL